jgi:tRNA U34 5-methylaminomethyl-2-thiouridine-forming methyltransferase MnmC
MKRTLVITKDGSHTLFVPALDEHYHSIHGALQESKHVFIKEGLNRCPGKDITVFEIGFGTGLNALLAYLESACRNIKINYYAIENDPLDMQIISKLNYPEILKLDGHGRKLFYDMHAGEWNRKLELHNNFIITKIKEDITLFAIHFTYDVVFFDAFAPQKQPEMWDREIFRKIYNNMAPGGILTTYSAKGEVKRILVSSGFKVETIQGPPGKREMIRARLPLKHFLNFMKFGVF